jgi:hypothetical protein
MKQAVTKIGEPKTSSNGNNYCLITLADGTEGLFFFRGNQPLQLNQEYEFEIKPQEGKIPIIKLAGERKQFQPRQTINKDLEVLKMAVDLACAGKIEVQKIAEWKNYLKSLVD